VAWRLVFERHAEREFDALDKPVRVRIARAIERLRGDPFASPNVKALAGSPDRRLRVGDQVIILIVRIAHRREVYRDL
jgi:mRNA-degrading endonuclease RelE of RelBE toxin-antitoxin system